MEDAGRIVRVFALVKGELVVRGVELLGPEDTDVEQALHPLV